jgi:hypothetical protein
VAVAAIGKAGVYPGTRWTVPRDRDKFGSDSLFLWKSSNFGGEITCCAPGVRIISTARYHEEAYQDMSGTSMSAPAVCAVLATILSRDVKYREMQRNADRAAHAKMRLVQSCRDIGLSTKYQGYGLVQLSRLAGL